MPALTRRRLLLEHADRIDSLRRPPARGRHPRGDRTPRSHRVGRPGAAREGGPAGPLRPRLRRRSSAWVGPPSVDGMTPEGGLLVGEALHELGRVRRGRRGADRGGSLGQRRRRSSSCHLTEIRSRNLMWGLLRFDEALEVNRRARAGLARPDGGRGAHAERGAAAQLLRPTARRARRSSSRSASSTRPRARALRALAEVPGAGRGRPLRDRGRRRRRGVRRAQPAARPDRHPRPWRAPARPGSTRLTECGRLAEATELAAAAYDATPATAPPDALMWLAHQLGRMRAALRADRDRPALAVARPWPGARSARASDRTGSCCPRLATADAVRGRRRGRRAQAVAELDQLPPFPFVEPEQELGRAWAHAVHGRSAGGQAGAARARPELARDRGYRTCEAWLLHDVARLGDPASVVDRLDVLAAECEGDLVAAYAAHAAAAAGSRPEAARRGHRALRAARRRCCSPPRRPARPHRRSSDAATGGRRPRSAFAPPPWRPRAKERGPRRCAPR